MHAKLVQRDGQLWLALPAELTPAWLHVNASEIHVTVQADQSVRLSPCKRPTLDELLTGITPELIGGEMEW